jgi:hypothetical protein
MGQVRNIGSRPEGAINRLRSTGDRLEAHPPLALEDYDATNSAIEVALAKIARALLGQLRLPLSFINAAMIPELAQAVGAWPRR